MSLLCVLPLRGGSKSIPKKNLAPLAGVPLALHVLRTAKRTPVIDRLVVSTDDEEISSMCRGEAVEVIRRPAELATDAAPTLPVIQHALTEVEEDGFRAEFIITLQATYPFLTVANIEDLFIAAKEHDTDSAHTVCASPYRYHPFNARTLNPDGSASFLLAEEKAKTPNRQAAPSVYYFGNLIITRRKTLMEGNSLYGEQSYPVIVSPRESFDIDDQLDLEIAEYLMSHK